MDGVVTAGSIGRIDRIRHVAYSSAGRTGLGPYRNDIDEGHLNLIEPSKVPTRSSPRRLASRWYASVA